MLKIEAASPLHSSCSIQRTSRRTREVKENNNENVVTSRKFEVKTVWIQTNKNICEMDQNPQQ